MGELLLKKVRLEKPLHTWLLFFFANKTNAVKISLKMIFHNCKFESLDRVFFVCSMTISDS